MARPSVYHYFGDREGLVVAALVERYRRGLAYSLDEAIALARTFTSRDQFVGLLHKNIQSFGSSDGIVRRRERTQVLGAAVSRPNLQAEVQKIDDFVVGHLAELLDLGKQRGWVTSTHDSVDLARWWVGVMNGRRMVDERDEALQLAWERITLDAIDRLLFGIGDTSA